MKRLTALVLAAVFLLALAGCGAAEDAGTISTDAAESTGAETVSAGNVLILYFSADNSADEDAVSAATPMPGGESSVQWMAEQIHDITGGDLVPIVPEQDYPLDYDELADAAKAETDDDIRPAIRDLGVDPASYDTVFLGYPIWWYTVPMVLETLLDQYDFSGVTVVPFNTHAGSGNGGTYDLIRQREPDATVLEGCPIRGEDAGEDSAAETIAEWLRDLGFAGQE